MEKTPRGRRMIVLSASVLALIILLILPKERGFRQRAVSNTLQVHSLSPHVDHIR
jgi:hypothetical protein